MFISQRCRKGKTEKNSKPHWAYTSSLDAPERAKPAVGNLTVRDERTVVSLPLEVPLTLAVGFLAKQYLTI